MIALGSDHGGYDLKERVKAYLDKESIGALSMIFVISGRPRC